MAKAAVRPASTSFKVVAEPVHDSEFRIEDGIPLPLTARPTRPERYFPFDKLKSGQSFLVSKDKKKGLRSALARFYAAHPAERRTIIQHKQDDGSVRVRKK
jgi:hypothetical protein